MPSGGARPGAGRKLGGKNRITLEKEAAAAGTTPLSHALAVLRDPKASERRKDLMAAVAAELMKAAAPEPSPAAPRSETSTTD